MNEVTLNPSELQKSDSNVRAGHTKEDIATMAHSISNRGIINPPSVAQNGDGKYRVIAGQLRVAGAIAAGLNEITCIDVTNLSDVERVDISLAENVHRRNMSAIELYKAFDKLFKSGMPTEQIGARFDKTDREVGQLLAIGCLPAKLLEAAERGDIGDRTLKALAIAPKSEVRRYCKLKVRDRPSEWQIQEWLAGADGMYQAKHALFDITEYTGEKMIDLFADEDEVWLLDGSQFMELQDAAVKAKLEDFEKKGWKIKQVDYWQSWAYQRTSKKSGGLVYYNRDDRTGAVEFHVGYTRTPKAGSAPKAKKANGKEEPKPETSKAFDAYTAEIRHTAVQRHMLDNKLHGLVGTFLLLLKECDNIEFRRGTQLVKGDPYCQSINESEDHQLIKDDFKTMLVELGVKDIRQATIEKLAPKLLEYTPATLTRWIITVVAASWELNFGPKTSDALGKAFDVQCKNWKLDDAFLNGITNKQTLLKIAKANKIPCIDTMTTKGIRKLLKEKLPSDWMPAYLKF